MNKPWIPMPEKLSYTSKSGKVVYLCPCCNSGEVARVANVRVSIKLLTFFLRMFSTYAHPDLLWCMTCLTISPHKSRLKINVSNVGNFIVDYKRRDNIKKEYRGVTWKDVHYHT